MHRLGPAKGLGQVRSFDTDAVAHKADVAELDDTKLALGNAGEAQKVGAIELDVLGNLRCVVREPSGLVENLLGGEPVFVRVRKVVKVPLAEQLVERRRENANRARPEVV